MSQERRRQARVQGCGWSQNRPKPILKTNKQPVKGTEPVPMSKGYPVWTDKNIDGPKEKSFRYSQPAEEEMRRKPPDRIIDGTGVHDLSQSENGLSRVKLLTSFLTPDEAEAAYSALVQEIIWKQKMNKKHGVSYEEPRMTAWFGDMEYRYSGVVQEANPQWSPTLIKIREKIEELTGVCFNSLLANLYRDGKDSVDWHSDNEPALGHHPVIASVSLGETRNFEMRRNPGADDCKDGERDYTYMEHVRIPLTHGSLLVMDGATQQDWQHRVPKEYHDRGPRINLTFRITHKG